MKPTLEDAIALAAQLHKGQDDKAGGCYILHPLRVMLNPIIKTDEGRIVAVLHDTVEDCGITFRQFHDLGYSEAVIEALTFLTKLPGEMRDYDAFIERIRTGSSVIARKVKMADLQDNSNLSRFSNPTEKDIRRQKKYVRAIARIETI